MEELQHFSHECALTLQEIVADNICSICYKDKPVQFACKPCNFHLCKSCSDLPPKVSHEFHSEHPLEFCLGQHERQPGYVVCSGCGDMSSGSFYECKECEIYLDLSCALLKYLVTGWNVKEMLHYSHSHMLRRSRPGPDARGSCTLCELPLSPSAICYGCVHCYSFFQERCLDLPTEIQHPVHPRHPLRRLDFTQTCGDGKYCNSCQLHIDGVPFGCLECSFDLHLRCADSLLRGLVHKSHQHMLFYVPNDASRVLTKKGPCQICMVANVSSTDFYYQCVQCDVNFHFECLEIPESVVKKSCHIHPLVCKIRFLVRSDSMEYCGVCETMINSRHHAYSCQECDFFCHIECILRKERPSPLYVKDLYPGGGVIPRLTEGNNFEHIVLGKKIVVTVYTGKVRSNHIHVMRPFHMIELDELAFCNICKEKILDCPWKCEICSFRAHDFCVELGEPSRHRLHSKHPLTLLSMPPARYVLSCDICKGEIAGFNLFCRVCNFIIDLSCALKQKHFLGVLGQKLIETVDVPCMTEQHTMAVVVVSRSYPAPCGICDEILNGKAVSCLKCEEIYHRRCFIFRRRHVFGHPLHSDHPLELLLKSGSKCIACKLNITKYGYHCYVCDVSFHTKCIKAVNAKSHYHYFYNFWMKDSKLSRVCCVCGTRCGESFYGCIDCNFNAHAECIGFPYNVKNQRHQHTLEQQISFGYLCSLCGSRCPIRLYFCNYCKKGFHKECIMSMDDREAAIEEEQLRDIYIMYIERDLFNLVGENES